YRPAIDPLFRSAAAAFGPRVVAVVLSGARSDGSTGAATVAEAGGTGIVQDPTEAGFPSMPAKTIAKEHPDCVMAVGEIAASVTRTVRGLSERVGVRDNAPDDMTLEVRYAALDRSAIEAADPPGRPSAFSCPECGGVLWELDDGELPRFRCRAGHA